MSLEQLESVIRELPLEERRRIVAWVEEHRHELAGEPADLTTEQREEILRRRADYENHPDRFVRMNESSLAELDQRVRQNAAARLSSAR